MVKRAGGSLFLVYLDLPSRMPERGGAPHALLGTRMMTHSGHPEKKEAYCKDITYKELGWGMGQALVSAPGISSAVGLLLPKWQIYYYLADDRSISAWVRGSA
jgi:hypothetical protein